MRPILEENSRRRRGFLFDSNNTETKYQTREEYTEKLKEWLEEARLWHTFCASFPHYLNIQNQNASAQVNFANIWNHVTNSTQQQRNPFINRNVINNNVNDFPGIAVFQPGRTYEFRIPPLWKRLTAEAIDFFILLFIKLIVTIILTQSFYVVDLDNYDFYALKKNLADPKIAMQMSIELISLEFLHRTIVCVYEIYWLKSEMLSTPGKRCLGMIVVQVETITAVPGTNDSMVRCTNVQPLELKNAIMRAVLKNVILAVMLPVFFLLYVFRFNRTGYDAVIKALVVEYPPISSS